LAASHFQSAQVDSYGGRCRHRQRRRPVECAAIRSTREGPAGVRPGRADSRKRRAHRDERRHVSLGALFRRGAQLRPQTRGRRRRAPSRPPPPAPSARARWRFVRTAQPCPQARGVWPDSFHVRFAAALGHGVTESSAQAMRPANRVDAVAECACRRPRVAPRACGYGKDFVTLRSGSANVHRDAHCAHRVHRDHSTRDVEPIRACFQSLVHLGQDVLTRVPRAY
jgi:hypothetical protein